MTYDEWLEVGISSGFCNKPVCGTHDGTDMTDEEAAAFEDGGDPCIPVVRLLPGDKEELSDAIV